MPQIIFLNSLFGYLSLLIIIKWCTGSKADLYHVMIYMFLSPFDDLGENELFWGQRPLQAIFLIHLLLLLNMYIFCHIDACHLQILLLLLAVIAVPWMLFPKPFILKKLQTEVAFYLIGLCTTIIPCFIYEILYLVYAKEKYGRKVLLVNLRKILHGGNQF